MIHKNITLIIVDCVEPEKAARVLSHCASIFPVEKSVLCTHEKIKNTSANIEIHTIDKLNTVDEYSEFILRQLHKHINTSHCLLIQTDGFIINPSLWNDSYFDYDFIGAPLTDYKVWHSFLPDWYKSLLSSDLFGEKRWPMNGGFSFRSKKLLELTAQCPHNSKAVAEDNYINVIHRDWFEEQGVKFPSREIAFTFSHENPLSGHPFRFDDCFGFHGKISPKHNEIANTPFRISRKPHWLKKAFKLHPELKITDSIALKIKTRFSFPFTAKNFKTLSCIDKTFDDTSKGNIDLFIVVNDNDVEKISQTISFARKSIKHEITQISIVGKSDAEISIFCVQHSIPFLENETEISILDKEHTSGFCIIRSGTIIIKAISFFNDIKPYVFYANTAKHFDVGIMYFDAVLFEKWNAIVQYYSNDSIEQRYQNYINWYLLYRNNPNYRLCKFEKRKWLDDAKFWVALYEPSDYGVILFEI